MIFGFFEKKSCALCGREGRLGNNTLPDDNVVCDDCIKIKSPYLGSIKRFKLEEVKQHLSEREANKQKVASFRETRVVGYNYKIRIDESQGLWLISRSGNYKNENPDVFTLDQVTGCNWKVDEDCTEKKKKTSNGEESYDPPLYEYDYEFNMVIYVNSPWFSEIRFKINDSTIDEEYSDEYTRVANEADEIRDVLLKARDEMRQTIKEAAKPKTSQICPLCQATTIPDANGRCEFCGGAMS